MSVSKRNAEGYHDPTAYEALKSCEKKKESQKMKKGEIWEIQQNNGTYKDVIVLSTGGDVAQVIQLSERGNDFSLTVNCQGIKYTDPRKIQYAFSDVFTTFIRALRDDEYKNIMGAVAEVLGLSTVQLPEADESQEEQEEWHPITEPVIGMPLPFDGDTEELIKAQTERDIYKGLYEKMLNSLMKVG